MALVSEADVARVENLGKRDSQPWLLPLLRRASAGEVVVTAESPYGAPYEVWNLYVSVCARCTGVAVWVRDKMIHPELTVGVVANEDLPAACKADFEEARTILPRSPRGAAALLRLVIQRLCGELCPDQSGADLNRLIATLVAKGLDVRVQQSLDVVRVIGNEAVHPGQLDLRDDTKTVQALFELVNIICDQLISQPKKIGAMYASLPREKLQQIERRDGKTPGDQDG